MDRHVLDKMIQSFLRSDENDAHEMCQDIKNTVEEYLVLNRAQLSVSERLLTVNEQLLAAQLRLLEANDNNNSTAPMADQLMVAADTAARDSSITKKNKKAAKKKRNKRNRAAAKKQKSEYVPWLNGGINPQVLMVIIGSFMTLLIMSLIPQSDGSKGASPPSFPPTAFLRHQRVREGINADTDSLITMEKSYIFSTSSSSAPLPPSSSLSSSINTCVDTPNWKDADGNGCNYYEENEDRRCPSGGSAVHDGGMGVARDNCCYCKDSSWKDLKERCQRSLEEGEVASCDEAASSICDATHEVKVLTMPNGDLETVGLYNKCKCDFWILMCEDTDNVACDYAAEYCCGDYKYSASEDTFYYLNSPACYCDFQDHLVADYGYDVKPKSTNVNSQFTNACDQFKDEWWPSHTHEDEKKSLEAMYARLGGDNWIDKDGWMTDTDHCEWFGISCDEDGYVTRVELGGNNLVGQFPVYTRDDPIGNYWRTSKYGLANLYKLVHLDLANNNLTGTIEYAPLYNLQELEYFNVSRNNLTGEADALVAPNLYEADFGNNTFTSMRRFEKYKYTVQDKLWWCDASNNKIRQDANDLLWHLPPKMEHFIASNNKIHGTLPEWQSLNSLKKLREFRMASNYISGTLPSFEESYTSLQHLDMSYQKKNGLTGQIPVDLWRTQSFVTVILAGNSLTGTIPSLVGDLNVMKEFDMSNNRLTGAIPSEVGNLAGSLKVFNVANNTITGSIPSQLGLLQGASIYLKVNLFNEVNLPAPLSLCVLRSVEAFDLESDPKLCPPQRNALNDFFDEAKGGDWLNDSLWQDEYAGYCSWNGVTCDETDHVTKLKLSTNGLSGKLSRRIADLTSLEELDLSNNDMKGPIPADLGLLSNLSYLRLSYNVFTGTAPAGLGDMKRLQLLQLQSNRITGMPNVPRLNDIKHGLSTYVTDCGVPSDFDEALACENCNAHDDCYPQQETKVSKSGLKDYGAFSGVLAVFFVVLCCMVTLLLYVIGRYKDSGTNLTKSTRRRMRLKDDIYALSAIGNDSVYKYFVGDNIFGWIAALSTIGVQIWILTVFIKASEVNLQDDKIDIQFTWKCPRDTDTCENKGDLDGTGWAIFCPNVDIIGCRGFGPLSVVSIIYNKALATSNSDIVVNSVVILFIMEIDEKIFGLLAAINEKWTTHAAESKDLITAAPAAMNDEGNSVDEMKDELANQKKEMEAQRIEIRMLREAVLDIQEAKEPSEASF
eukprot:scaffold323_cov74-Skeletonema_dohrnii-CCMP3373.AAC.6